MPDITVVVVKNRFPSIAAQLPEIVDRAVRKQVKVSEGNIKVNIAVKYGAVDTGAMLGSTQGKLTGHGQGEVSVSAESEQGYPYPAAVNYGTVHMSPRPFFSDEVAKARGEFPRRMAAEIEAAL